MTSDCARGLSVDLQKFIIVVGKKDIYIYMCKILDTFFF